MELTDKYARVIPEQPLMIYDTYVALSVNIDEGLRILVRWLF